MLLYVHVLPFLKEASLLGHWGLDITEKSNVKVNMMPAEYQALPVNSGQQRYTFDRLLATLLILSAYGFHK